MQPKDWKFDVASFMILLGEDYEFRYRLMRRGLAENLSIAPVAGLQNYLRSYSELSEATGIEYISPFGCKKASLRNMRLAKVISQKDLLQNGRFTVYRLPNGEAGTGGKIISAWTLTTYVIFIAIVIGLRAAIPNPSWIGSVSCGVLSLWSMTLRLLEPCCVQTVGKSAASPDDEDAAIILGRRDSCVVVEGFRMDVMAWTGLGVELIDSPAARAWRCISRLGSLLVLVLMFATITNGTICDQVQFIALNLLGLANLMLGLWLNATSCTNSFKKLKQERVESRTEVWGILLRKFPHGEWVSLLGIPKTDVWDDWKARVVVDLATKPKELYKKCLKEVRRPEPANTPSMDANQCTFTSRLRTTIC